MSLLSKHDRDQVRVAAELSLVGSQTLNPIIALMHACGSLQTLENLNKRYGPELCREITGVDIQQLIDSVTHQKQCILADLLHSNPQWRPAHPLPLPPIPSTS